jgi:nitronate monooxygenase
MSASLPFALFGAGVVAAPMAGGPGGPSLVQAVGRAGALGILAAGYKTPALLRGEVESLCDTGVPFGVNLFVPRVDEVDRGAVLAYRERVRPLADRLHAELPGPRWTDDDHYREKLELLLTMTPPVVSFTFALPAARDVARLRAAGAFTVQTVTGALEARAAAEAGVDAVVVQHPDAGGHSGAFLPDTLPHGSLADLVAQVRAAVALPAIGAGGIGDPAAARRARDAGAAAVQLGTAFLRTPEAGTNAVHRAALADARFVRTARTRAFSGRTARGLQNAFMREFADAPLGYPTIHYLTGPLRAAAVAASDAQHTNLWAGTGWRRAREEAASDVVARFALA